MIVITLKLCYYCLSYIKNWPRRIFRRGHCHFIPSVMLSSLQVFYGTTSGASCLGGSASSNPRTYHNRRWPDGSWWRTMQGAARRLCRAHRNMSLPAPTSNNRWWWNVSPSFLLTFVALHTNVIVILLQFYVRECFTKTKSGLSWEKKGLRFWTFPHHPSPSHPDTSVGI